MTLDRKAAQRAANRLFREIPNRCQGSGSYTGWSPKEIL